MTSPQTIAHHIQHLAVLLNRQADQVLQEQLGIGLSQFRIMEVLQAEPASRQKNIASCLGQTEASISRQAKLMQTRAIVSIATNPQNRREHAMSLTPKGEKLLEAGTQVLTQHYELAFTSLSAKDQTTLDKLLAVANTDSLW